MNSHPIRVADRTDAPQLAALIALLGHATSSERIERMWDEWSAGGNAALVAVGPENALIGAITTHQMLVLHRPLPVGRITSLIVKDGWRGAGIGRTLVASAENLLRERGCGLVEITSHFRFPQAHAFYEHLGYTRTSFRFARDLPAVGSD